MKNSFTTLHEANRTYHSFRQSAKALLHRSETALVASVILYRLATSVLFVPLMQQLWSLTLRFAPMHYLSNNNASDIFTSPAIVGCIALIAILTAFWTLYEFSVLLHGLELARRGEKIRFGPLLCSSLMDIRHAFLPWNWPVLLYSAVLIPFTSFFLTSNYITQLAVPEYILGVIRANARYHALYAIACVLILLLCLTWALVLPLFVLERRSLWQSVKESVGYVRSRLGRVFLLLARWNLSVVLRAALLGCAVLVPLYGVILAVGMQSTQAMFAMSRAALLIELPFFQFLIDCSITAAQCSILAMLYYHLRGYVPFELEPPVSGKRWRTSGKAVIAASIAGVTMLTLALSMVYLALPKDDELLSLLGGTAPIITSHRGYSSAAPENTLPAFQLAIDHGSDRAELDVQMTKDDQLVVIHDERLDRTTTGTGYVKDYTFAQIRALAITPSGQGRPYESTGHLHVPALAEVFALLKPYCEKNGLLINIELKNSRIAYKGMEKKVIAMAENYGISNYIVYSSFCHASMGLVKKLDKNAKTGLLSTNILDAIENQEQYHADALHPCNVGMAINRETVQYLKERNIPVRVWNGQEPLFGQVRPLGKCDLERYTLLGATDLFTNVPENYLE